MINSFFWITYAALWVLVIVLFAAVFFLYRYHGQMLLNSREGRKAQGPELNVAFPSIRIQDLAEEVTHVGPPSGFQFFFFASTKCQPCRQARVALGLFAEQYKAVVETYLICRGSHQEVASFAKELPASIKIVPDRQGKLSTELRISSTPFALITDSEGIVRAKGMPDRIEAFEWFIKQLSTMPKDAQSNSTVQTNALSAHQA